MLRGGWGVSYVHFNRAGGGNILSINSPQVINAVAVQGNALAPTFRTTQEGYPAGFTDPSKFDPARREHHLHAARLSFGVGAKLASVGAARDWRRTWSLDVAYVGNRAEDMLLFANYNQAVAE